MPILILAAAAAAGVWYWRMQSAEASTHLLVSGNIELTEVDIAFKTAGRLVELAVDEGAAVKKGTLIARLDPKQPAEARARDEAAVAAAESQLRQLETAIAYQRATLEGEVALRAAEARAARANLEDLLAGSRAQEIEQAEAAAADLRLQHEWAKREWERAQRLYKDEDISFAQYDQAQTRFAQTRQQLAQAEQRLALVREGPRAKTIEAARAQLARAEAAQRLAEASRIELKRREQELETRRAEIARARAQAAIAAAQLEDTVVYAPIDGVVLAKSVEPGEIVAAGTPVVGIGDLRRPWLRAYIGERDLGRVKLGQRVKLTTDSYPGKVYEGRVSFIASQAEFTPKQIQTKEERVRLVYRIKIEVENPAQELKNNMPVDAEILL
jgi:HlyD family secretion protein